MEWSRTICGEKEFAGEAAKREPFSLQIFYITATNASHIKKIAG
jgi:hypothetical protein